LRLNNINDNFKLIKQGGIMSGLQVYQEGGQGVVTAQFPPVASPRDPISSTVSAFPDIVGSDGSPYNLLRMWINTTTKSVFMYLGQGVWVLISTGTGDVTSVTGSANQIFANTNTGAVILSLIGPYTPSTYTLDGVLYGNTTSSIGATVAGTNGQTLIGNTSLAPSFAAIGTLSGLTEFGVITMGATAFVATTAGSAGQYLVSNATSAPTFQTATPQLVVTPVAVATQAMTSNHKYIANDASLTTFTLPTSSSVGDIIQIVGSALNTNGWKVTYTTGQIIWGPAGSSTATSGNAASATLPAQAMSISCVVANTTWVITDNSGTITLT